MTLIVMIVLIVWLGILLQILVFNLYFALAQNKNKYQLISIKIPQNNECGPIVAEHIFAALHGINAHFSWKDRFSRLIRNRVSLEIVSSGSSVFFCIAFPESLRNLIEGQIYAHYPEAEIKNIPDYVVDNFADSSRKVIGTELNLVDSDIFPIKRYSQFEDKLKRTAVDPLAGIISTLLKLENVQDQAWIQVVISPVSDKWRIVLTKCIRIMNASILVNFDRFQRFYARLFTSRNNFFKVFFFPLYLWFYIKGIMVNTRVEDNLNIEEQTALKSHERETSFLAAIDKVVKLLFEVKIRIVLIADHNEEYAKNKIREIVSSFKQFNLPHLNGFKCNGIMRDNFILSRYLKRILNQSFILNTEELASIYHLPDETVQIPFIDRVYSKKLFPPSSLPQDGVNFLGTTNFRDQSIKFGIKTDDRRRHLYIIGKTRMGKTTLLENLIYNDISAGNGLAIVDPHGDLAEKVINFIPKNRINDVIFIDPADQNYAVGFNLLECEDPQMNHLIASGLIGIMKKIYGQSWGPRLEYILRNTILTLIQYGNSTILGIPRILTESVYRNMILKKISDPVLLSFWRDEFEKMPEKLCREAIAPIQNKVGQFLASPVIRNIVGQLKSTVDFRFAMDKGKIVIINLSKGRLGEDNSGLLGAMFITKIQLDAMSRSFLSENDRRDFYLYVDEFQNFATDSFATILSEARKYRLNLILANQYITQMPLTLQEAVFGNVGNLLSFQVGYDDADYLVKQFGEVVSSMDLVNLNKYSAYVRILIDGMPSKVFSFNTLPPVEIFTETEKNCGKIINASRERYCEKAQIIEQKIRRWSGIDFKKKYNFSAV